MNLTDLYCWNPSIQTAAFVFPDPNAGRLRVTAEFKPLPALPLPRSKPHARLNYIDEVDPNYRAVRERIIELVKAGHKVERWELRAPRDGFRLMRMYVKDGPPLTWDQPWLTSPTS